MNINLNFFNQNEGETSK